LHTVVLTGASRGIGWQLARLYAEQGDRVIGGSRKRAEAPASPSVEELVLNVTDSSSVEGFATALSGQPVDLLINSAGVIGPKTQSSLSMDFDGFAEALAVNTLGPLRVTQALLPNLRSASEPKIIILTSRMGSLSYAKSDRVAYRASKAAANKVVQCLATDLATEGIAVAAIHPGWARTELGGPEADLDPAESAEGVKSVADRLTLSTSGRFWNYDGTELAW